MSFIKKIVDLVEKNDDVDARNNIESMKKEVKQYQEKVKSYIDHNYVEFLSDITNNEMYLESGNQLQANLANLFENISNDTKNSMYVAQNEVSKYIEELEEISKSLKISTKLMKIDELLQQIDQLNQCENYSEINNVLTTIQLILKDPENKIIRKLDMYDNLKLRLGEEQQKMLLNLENRLDNCITMTEKTFPSTKAIIVSISKDKDLIRQTVETLYDAEFDFQKYTDFLLTNIFAPSIEKPVSLDILESEKEYLLNLSYTTKEISEDLRPNYKSVFSNMKHLLYFLINMNALVNGQIYFLEYLFENVQEELMDLLVNKCIIYSIPGTIEERNESTMKEDIGKVCKLFDDTHFIADLEGSKLSEFAQRVDDLFQNRFSQNILNKASEIMKKDLHDMVLVPENVTSTSPTSFARCMISKSTLEIIGLLEKVLKEANASPNPAMADSLRAAVDSVLQQYSFIIQQHHSKFLSKIPQQTALFYNNCLFLAFWIANNELIDGKNLEVAAKMLVKEGTDIFDCQMDKQKIALADLLVNIGEIFNYYFNLGPFNNLFFQISQRQSQRYPTIISNRSDSVFAKWIF
jgi:centromere/kinetochore protein ZW10